MSVIDKSEASVQQRVRLKIAKAGAYSWRNNIGATPSRCPHCDARLRPVRYGLANDTPKLNAQYKSSDIIAAIPRIITLDMVGKTIAQFGSFECKHEDWVYTATESELAQKRWIDLINYIGGYAQFTLGNIEL